MTDYVEEQRNEIEALEAIFPSEMIVLETKPYHVFTICIQSDEAEDDEMRINLKFAYVNKYPDVVPAIEVESSENVLEDDEALLLELLRQSAEENLGDVMIFTLVSMAMEWLKQLSDEIKNRKILDEELRKKHEEEAELKKFEGTRVTVESFLTWKDKFDLEMTFLKGQQAKLDLSKKLTGRELFEKDTTLNESDLQFLQDGEEEVKVDESLFEELDGLDLEEAQDSDS